MFFTVRHELKNTRQLRGMVSSNGVVYFLALDVAKMAEIDNPKLFAAFATSLRIRDVTRKELELESSVSKIRIFTTGETAAHLQFSKSQFANAMGRLIENYKTTRVSHYPQILPVLDIKKACQNQILLLNRWEEEAEQKTTTITIAGEKEDCSEVVTDSLNNFLRDYTSKCLESYEEIKQKNKVRVRVEMHIMQPELKEFELSAAPETLTVHFGGKVFEYKLV